MSNDFLLALLGIVIIILIICVIGAFIVFYFRKRNSKNQIVLKNNNGTTIENKNENKANIQVIYDKKVELDNLIQENMKLKEEYQISKSNCDNLAIKLKSQLNQLEIQRNELNIKKNKIDDYLTKIVGISKQEASKYLLEKLTQDLSVQRSKIINEFEMNNKSDLEQKANQILIDCMERIAEDFVISKSTYTIKLEEDNIKGRIIGKDGRNKKCFEQITGVDLIIEKEPEVTISCLNPIRREIAKNLLEKLIQNKNIEPSRIEKYFLLEKDSMDKRLYEIGQETLEYKLQIFDVNKELYPYVGRLFFRTSYSQNNLYHAIESALLASNIAIELNLDPYKAKKAAFFHDIGKATDFEMDNDHVESGISLAKQFGLEDYVLNAIESHHDKVPCNNIYAAITKIVDKISASRPGARYISHEEYIKKINTIEEICNSFEGVKNSYAIKAGKQVRVIIDPKILNDDQIITLTYDIKAKIENEEITNKQPIEIIVIRENRYELKTEGSASRNELKEEIIN